MLNNTYYIFVELPCNYYVIDVSNEIMFNYTCILIFVLWIEKAEITEIKPIKQNKHSFNQFLCQSNTFNVQGGGADKLYSLLFIV